MKKIMKVIQIHNSYRLGGGEEIFFETTIDLLCRKGISLFLLTENSKDIDTSLRRKLNAFFSGIYSIAAGRRMTFMIRRVQPDFVHVHNLYPLISPSVLVSCKRAGVPVVMTCHNYILVCPTGIHIRKGEICELCLDGREYWCLINNCRDNIFESVHYALRNWVARRFRLISKNISLFTTVSNFLKERLVASGLEEEKIVVLPNFVPLAESAVDASQGKYIAFAGRFSEVKGINVLLAAAKKMPQVPFMLAGDWSPMPKLLKEAPKNVKLLGWLDREQLTLFYRNARFLVVPSIWFEPFGLVAAEGMSHGLPVIASRIGGLPEVVEDGVTGLLFEAGNEQDLAEKIIMLWDDPNYGRQLGKAGREKAMQEYSQDVYLQRLLAVYQKAKTINKNDET